MSNTKQEDTEWNPYEGNEEAPCIILENNDPFEQFNVDLTDSLINSEVFFLSREG